MLRKSIKLTDFSNLKRHQMISFKLMSDFTTLSNNFAEFRGETKNHFDQFAVAIKNLTKNQDHHRKQNDTSNSKHNFPTFIAGSS
jgi:hypothetical protein